MVFVGAMGMGVEGAALATIIAQFASALLCLYRLMKKSPEEYTVSLRKINLDPYMVKQIVSNGSSGWRAELCNCHCQRCGPVQYQQLQASWQWQAAGAYSKVEGFGPADPLLFHGTDYFYQPEPWSQEIRPREKGRAHWNPVQHFHGRSGWNYCVFCKSGSDCCL